MGSLTGTEDGSLETPRLVRLAEAQNELLRTIAATLGNGSATELIAEQLHAIKQLNSKIDKLNRELTATKKSIDVVRLNASRSTIERVSHFARGRQLSFEQTMERLVESNISFSRFGDGELRMMASPNSNLGFQRNNPHIRRELRKVFDMAPHPELMVGWPHIYRDMNGSQLWSLIWDEIEPHIPAGVMYGNSHVSRPIYFSYMGAAGVNAWRSVWDGKRICIITGENTRFEMAPQLFNGIRDARYLPSVPRNADADIERLLTEVDRIDADMFLISLGPAGTVLSARIALAGKRAIDVGHISNSYANIFKGQAPPEALPAAR